MKTIALFGASGKTGQQLLEQALAKGYSIRALVRNPARVPQQHPNLVLVQGDVLNEADVEKTIAGTSLVVSLFGHVKGSHEWLQTDGTRNIVAAMQKHGVRRIISLSGGGLPYPEKDRPKFADKLIRTIMRIAVPKTLNDAVRHHEVLRNSGLQWTIVRGPRLTDTPAKGQYRVGWVGVDASTSIGRADLAHFIVRLVADESFDGMMPFVSY